MNCIRRKRHRTKKKALKKFFRRMLRRYAVCVAVVLVLVTGWKLTSFAVKSLTPAKEQKEDLQEPEDVFSEEEPIRKISEAEDAPYGAENLLLVNKDHPLDESYQPNLKRNRDYGVDVDASIFDALKDMLAAGEKQGLSFWIASGYRSPQRQRELLDEDIADLVCQGYTYSEAYEEVVRETMPVGCSEHATGLCVDIVAKNYQFLDEKQGSTKEILWLQENCSQYGFILRYPEGKEDITKISYESWHFRYVGVDAAKQITEQGITLEEYLESLE